MKRTPDDIRSAIDTTLSGASHDPTLFNRVVNASKGDTPPVKKKLTLSMALVLVLMLLTGTAIATTVVHGVTYFLTDRTTLPIEINPALLMTNLTQENTSQWLDATVQDAYWDGTEVSLTIRVTPKDPATPICLEFGIGADGESDDRIWFPDAEFTGTNMLVEDWLAGRSAIQLRDPNLTFTTEYEIVKHWYSLDYIHVPGDNAIILLLQFPVNDMTGGGQAIIHLDSVMMHPGDTPDAAHLRWEARQAGETEEAFLTVFLPALTDPFPEHECDFSGANCVTYAHCSICGRHNGELGKHQFSEATCQELSTCPICGITIGQLANHTYLNGTCKWCNKPE